MPAYVLVEGHGESDAVANLLARLISDRRLAIPRFAKPIRAPGIRANDQLLRYAELVRCKRDAEALLVLRDDEDGCPRTDGPAIGDRVRAMGLPFPAAVVLAFREYESLFLPCIREMAGRPFVVVGGLTRPGLKAGAGYEGDPESRRGVKEWLSSQMDGGRSYKPALDQLALTRMIDFDRVRKSGLPWFGTLERALGFLSLQLGTTGRVYPPSRHAS